MITDPEAPATSTGSLAVDEPHGRLPIAMVSWFASSATLNVPQAAGPVAFSLVAISLIGEASGGAAMMLAMTLARSSDPSPYPAREAPAVRDLCKAPHRLSHLGIGCSQLVRPLPSALCLARGSGSSCRFGEWGGVRISACTAQPHNASFTFAPSARHCRHPQRTDVRSGACGGLNSGHHLACIRGPGPDPIRRCAGPVGSAGGGTACRRHAAHEGFGSQSLHLAVAYLCGRGRVYGCIRRDRCCRACSEVRV
jgi:hypothetical protein